MKCIELEVANLKGSTLPLLEMGGVYLDNGHKIIVSKEYAARLKLQYKPYLVEVKELEKASLQGGWYEIPRTAAAPKKEPEKQEAAPVEEDKGGDSMEEVKEDKSMRTKKNKKKVRTK